MMEMSEEHMKKKMKMLMAVGVFFMLLGLAMHLAAVILEFGMFAPLQEEYWSIPKAERDAATSGSEPSQMLVEIQKFPPKLMTLKLVGIGSILTGIFLMLLGILKALVLMPVKLAGIICPECAEKKKEKPMMQKKRRRR